MRHVVLAGLAILLVACATPGTPIPDKSVAEAAFAAPWSLQGRIAVKSDKQSLSGQLQWLHRATSEELLLSSPLGQGVARIVSDAQGVLLEIPKRPPRRAPDAESLTREALGVALPLSGLSHWIRLRPDPARPFEQTVDTAGRVTQIRQDNWVIDYLEYMDAPAYRPRKINVAREGLQIRLVIDVWETE